MSETINTKFDHATLPAWALQDSAVVYECMVDLAFRCAVYDAKTGAMCALLKEDARRRQEQRENS